MEEQRTGPLTLDPLYATRFPEADRGAKDAIWQVLCPHFFQRYVGRDDVVVDIGAGFGEFLRHIRCRRRIAVDVERLSGRMLPPGTEEVFTPSHRLSEHVPANSVDLVFCSNFFEHLPDTSTFLATLKEIHAVLRPGGRLMALQPNIRLVGGAYWDFVDHHLPITDRSLVEACQSLGFEIVEVIPRFLPYTTRSAIPQSPWLVRLYLAIRPVWWLLGKQTFLVARKSGGAVLSRG
jgi:SAM-dependent methyltransferase